MTLTTTSKSDHFAVTDTSAQSTAMIAGHAYRFVCTVDCYVAFGANPTASGADDNHIVGAGRELLILAHAAVKVAALRIGSTSGAATLSITT